MLTTEEKRTRLEELLARVQRNRIQYQENLQSVEPERERADATNPQTALPAPIEPKPVHRISSVPKSFPSPQITAIAAPMEPEPIARESFEPEPEPMPLFAQTPAPKLSPTPAPEPEPKPLFAQAPAPKLSPTPAPEPEPKSLFAQAPAPKLSPTPAPEPEPKPLFAEAPAPKPSPEASLDPLPKEATPMLEEPSLSFADEPPRIFEAKIEASSPIASVHGQADRSWTLRAVLERAWRLGQTEVDDN